MSTESHINSKYIPTELDKISKNRFTKQYKISNRNLLVSALSVMRHLLMLAYSVPVNGFQNLESASSERFHGRERKSPTSFGLLANRDLNCLVVFTWDYVGRIVVMRRQHIIHEVISDDKRKLVVVTITTVVLDIRFQYNGDSL